MDNTFHALDRFVESAFLNQSLGFYRNSSKHETHGGNIFDEE